MPVNGVAHALRVREQLDEERRTRAGQLDGLERDGEAGHDDAARNRVAALRRTIEEIDAALARLDAGTYGACVDCTEPIPDGRLEILPYTARCVRCQQRSG